MKQLFSSHASGWMVLAALLASSGHLAGCDTNAPSKKDVTPGALTQAQENKPSVAKSAKEVGTQAALSEPTAAKTTAPLDEKTAEKSEAETSEKQTTLVAPFVKRLVIASDIKEREPVELTDAKVDEPVVAFVELKNAEEEEMGVVVTFEHADGNKVGFVELTVPGKSPRFRTWARTRNIKTPGEWTAVVTSKSGEELARKTFQVAG